MADLDDLQRSNTTLAYFRHATWKGQAVMTLLPPKDGTIYVVTRYSQNGNGGLLMDVAIDDLEFED